MTFPFKKRKKHNEELWRKSTYKVNSFRRIRKYLTVQKVKLLANAFINSWFTYVPLFWVLAGKPSIPKILLKLFQVVYSNYDESYNDLLNFSNGLFIHQNYLRFLATEVYQSFININPEFMWELFSNNLIQYN